MPLLEAAERYARGKGYRILRYMIGSTAVLPRPPLGRILEELKNLKSLRAQTL
jgi:DNA invertase Pin-like site-specific DNA recombinase